MNGNIKENRKYINKLYTKICELIAEVNASLIKNEKKRMEALMPTLEYYGAQDLADIIYNNI